MNFAVFQEMRARAAPEETALVDSRVRMTHGEVDDAANRFANLLAARGLGEGHRVAICLANRAELVIAVLGCFKAGVIAVPLNWRLADAELIRLIDHCAPTMLVVPEARNAALRRPGVSSLGVEDASRQGSFWSELAAASPERVCRPLQNAAIANLLFTSGTTSFPKAVIHTHGMRTSIGAAMADSFRLSSRDVALAVSPLFHTGGFSVFSNAVFAGCKLVLLEKWELPALLALIEAERVTFMHLITTIVVDIARAPAEAFDRDVSSMRLTWGGGHAVDPRIFELFEQRIGGVFVLGYSRTEGGLTYNRPDRARRRFDINGYANENSSEVGIFDPSTGKPVAAGATGEICVRGDGVSPGYWAPDYIRVHKLLDGGWQRTGDRGVMAPDGAMNFLGRYDEMIKTGGENVYPQEVQSVLLDLPYVKDAVVTGVPDARLGQRVAAAVVLREADAGMDRAAAAARIDRDCRTRLGGFQVPRVVLILEKLPQLGTQKVDMAACQKLLEAAAASA